MKKLFFLFILFFAIGFPLLYAQSLKKISGKVLGDGNIPLSGVSVQIKGASGGSFTNKEGVFSIGVPNNNFVLVFSYVGYETLEQNPNGNSNLTISLVPAKKTLDEVIVVGYGTVRKKDLTGSVVSVKGSEITKVAAANPMESIQGKVSGVDIVRTSGAAGANVNVTVRGNRSLPSAAGGASNTPLYIVDGIQYSNYQDINSSDIQSLDVLKDAASTAIYGSRGANGVILITTKRGANGKTKVTGGSYYGVSEVVGYPTPMTGPQFADIKRQAYRTANPLTYNPATDDAKVFTSAADLAAVQNGTSTYWPGTLINKGSQQDYNVGVSGGNDKTKVFFSFDYYKEKGLLSNDYSNRYSLRLNIDQAITNNFKVGLQSQLAYYDQNLRADAILTVANKVLPYYTPYNTDGTLAKYPGNGSQLNPLLEGLPGAYANQINITRLLSTAYAEWKPFTGMTIRSNLGVVNGSSSNGHFEGANTISRALSSGSLSSITNATQTDLTWENILTYQKKFKEHSLTITGVTSYLSFRTVNSSESATGQLLPGQSFYALQNNPANLALASSYVGSNLLSGAFRVNYAFKDRYLFTATGRADGASQLAPQNHWSFFPSVAGAWRIIDESFMKNQHVVSDLKLRVSYGIAGNAAVPAYKTQSALDLIPYSWNDVTALAYGLDPQIGNPNLNWELTATTNVGLDFGLVKNRVSGSIDFYDSKTKDLLYLLGLPPTTGAQSILSNVGKTSNQGFEISLHTVNIQNDNFSWTSGISYTRNKERVVYLPNGNDIANNLFIGSPVVSFYDYQKVGIWQTADSTLAKSYGYKPGDIRVKDVDNSGTITALGDRVVLGSAVPTYSVGFTNDFKYKNFDLNLFFFARVGQMFVSQYANKFEPNAVENGANVNYWTPENPTNDYPRPDSRISRAALPFATTLGYKDGSFLKLRNVTLGYTFTSALAKKMHISSFRWYVSAKNYLTISKVKDYDPEGGGSFESPLTKLLVTGLNIEF